MLFCRKFFSKRVGLLGLRKKFSFGLPNTPTTSLSQSSSFAYGCTNFLESEAFFVDKTHFLLELESLGNADSLPLALVLMAPRRFGKSTTAATMSQYYDHKMSSVVEARAKELQLKAWLTPSQLKNKYFVMELDFSGLVSYPYTLESFMLNFNIKLRRQVGEFVKKYGLESEVPDNCVDAVDYFVRVINAVNSRNPDDDNDKAKMAPLIIIDEYDTSTNLMLLKYGQNLPKDSHIVPFINFYAELKTLCSRRRAHSYITGISPLALSEFGAGFNIAQRPQQNARFAEMFGFTDADMRSGIRCAGVTDKKLEDDLMKWYTQQYNGYRFHIDAPGAGVFNPNQAIYEFNRLEDFIRYVSQDSAAIKHHVTNEGDEDANSMPAGHVLDMVASIPAMGDLLPLIAPVGGVVSIPQLLPFVRVQDLPHSSDVAHLYTFLYYHGLLTHAKKYPKDTEESESRGILLAAPNSVARMEVQEEILKRCQVSAVSAVRLKRSFGTWREQGDPSEFLTTFSQAVNKYCDIDAVWNESSFVSALHSVMSVCQEPTDKIDKDKPLGQCDIDLLFETPTAIHMIDVRTVCTEHLQLAGVDAGWGELVEISKALLTLNDSELLAENCEMYRTIPPTMEPLSTHVDEWTADVDRKYVNNLVTLQKLANDKKKIVVVWLVVRVGLHRVIHKQIKRFELVDGKDRFVDLYEQVKKWFILQSLIANANNTIGANVDKYMVIHWRRGDQLTTRCLPDWKGYKDASINCKSATVFVDEMNRFLEHGSRSSNALFRNISAVLVATNEQNQTELDVLRSHNYIPMSDMFDMLRHQDTSCISCVNASIVESVSAHDRNRRLDTHSVTSLHNLTSLESFIVEAQFMLHAPLFVSFGISQINDVIESERSKSGRPHCIHGEAVDHKSWCEGVRRGRNISKNRTAPPPPVALSTQHRVVEKVKEHDVLTTNNVNANNQQLNSDNNGKVGQH